MKLAEWVSVTFEKLEHRSMWNILIRSSSLFTSSNYVFYIEGSLDFFAYFCNYVSIHFLKTFSQKLPKRRNKFNILRLESCFRSNNTRGFWIVYNSSIIFHYSKLSYNSFWPPCSKWDSQLMNYNNIIDNRFYWNALQNVRLVR